MSSDQLQNDKTINPTTNTNDKQPNEPKRRKKKKKMTAEDRRRLAEERRKRILARESAGLEYIQKQLSKEEMIQRQTENLENINNIIENANANNNNIIDPHTHLPNDIDNSNVPIHQNGPLTDPFTALLTQSMQNPNFANMSGMSNGSDFSNISDIGMPGMGGMGGMPNMAQLLGAMSSMPGMPGMGMPGMGMPGLMGMGMDPQMMAEQQRQRDQLLQEKKHNEWIDKMEKLSHLWFVGIFVFLLILFPSLDVFGYNLETDTFSFFIGIELILFSGFYGYKHYKRRTQQTSTGFGIPIIDQLLGSGLLGNGFLGRMMNRMKIANELFGMLKQFGSDLCLIVFLWVMVTAIRSYLQPFIFN